MKRSVFLLAAFSLTSTPTAVWAHADILVSRIGDRLVTGGYDFDAPPGSEVIPPPLRVFGYDFGEIPGQPDFAEDPGFVSLAGTFPAGTAFSFSVLDDLKFWMGSGFGPVPGHESLLIEKGSFAVTVGTGEPVPKPGFTIGSTSGVLTGQQLHEHIDVTLLGPNGDFLPLGADGVYLLKLALHGTGGLIDSDPFWVVYNHGVDESTHDAAIDWAQTHLAPEPTSLLLLGIGGGVWVRRQQRVRA